MQSKVQGHVKIICGLKALVRRSLPIATLSCAQALSACSAADMGESGEEVATSEEAFTATAGLMPGVSSYEGAIVSRGAGLLDLFVRASNGNLVYHRYLAHNGWLTGVDLGRPSGVSLGASVAATVNGGRIDVFAVGSNAAVYHRFSNVTTGAPTWSDWFQVPDITVKGAQSLDAITVSSWGPGRLDLFYITPNGNLGHKWGENYRWTAGVETGDSAATWYLKPPSAFAYSPPIESVSTKLGRLDIILGTQAGVSGIKHHAYYADAGHWQQPRNIPCCFGQTDGGIFEPNDFVVAKMGSASSTSFSVYVKRGSTGGTLQQLAWQNGWYQPGGSGSRIFAFDTSQPLSLLNIGLTDAVQHTGTTKTIVGVWPNQIQGWKADFQ